MKLSKKSEEELRRAYEVEALQLRETVRRQALELEQKNRELEIEAALERVRARSAAMLSSSELSELMLTIFKSIISLGIPEQQVEVCYITTFDPLQPIGEIFLAKYGSFIPGGYKIRYDEDPLFKAIYQHWKKGESLYVGRLKGQSLHDHFHYMRSHTTLPALQTPEEVTNKLHETFTHALFFSQGYLAVVTRQAVDSFHPIFLRFGNVLQQTYTRFLDLQKAEAQAREAQIEAALEKVRGRSLAMRRSDELNEVVSVLFEKLRDLHIPASAVGIGIYIEGSKDLDSYVCGENETGLVITN